jgi:uncharacterized membrane protein
VEAIRLTLHVLAACVWVGGQITVLGLLPTLRAIGGDAPRLAARQFRRIAWPAFAVLLLTGVWNLVELNKEGRAGGATLSVKLAMVAASGVATYLHERATSRQALAAWGAVGFLTSLVALFLGVVLAEPEAG